MFRAFVLPVVLMSVVGIPMLYSHHQRKTAQLPTTESPQTTAQEPWQAASYRSMNEIASPATNASTTPNLSPPANPWTPMTGFPQATVAKQTLPPNNATITKNSGSVPVATTSVSTLANGRDNAWAQPGMIPDFAKAETLVFPGDANGPDLSAQPMSFTPTLDLSSLFRFDVTKRWVTSKWDRVSTCPAEQGLHGMRVALVTGTNSWDLHGSLTYWFDVNHRVQRITYRGWTGDASRLLQTLQPIHGLKPQPTHWAGLYLSKRSGLMMKHPAVIDKSNPVQHLALILELNNPQGRSPLSNNFRALLPAAISPQ